LFAGVTQKPLNCPQWLTLAHIGQSRSERCGDRGVTPVLARPVVQPIDTATAIAVEPIADGVGTDLLFSAIRGVEDALVYER
jgi:hypothetical protein